MLMIFVLSPGDPSSNPVTINENSPDSSVCGST
jgi:hypothetical protein